MAKFKRVDTPEGPLPPATEAQAEKQLTDEERGRVRTEWKREPKKS